MPGIDGGPGRRDALIIAAGRYQDPSFAALRSPSQDAAELAEVLSDRAIGGFDARVLLDEPGHLLREEIDGFLAERRPEDLLVLYLSCHGIKDVDGLLHFAVSTTKFSRLASTGISASFVHEQIDRCKARKILLLLDCCYSGAYPKGHRPKAKSRAEIKPFDGRGRAVITSCTDLQYAFEVDTQKVSGTAGSSVFTAALVEGLRTGRADRDGDGQVSIDELYAYVFDRVRQTTPHQTPEKIWGEIRGDFIIAANPRPPACPAATTTQTTGHDRQPATTRRVLLGLATATAAGLAITGWDLAHQNPTTRRPNPATTPIPLWTFGVPKEIPPGPLFLELMGDVIYTISDGELYALRASDGRKLWNSKYLGYLAGSADGAVVYAAGPYALYALRASNGSKIWRAPIANLSGLAMADGVIYAADGYGDIYALRASDGARLWSFIPSQGEPSGVAAAGDVVYTGGSNQGASVYALRAGNQIWKSPIGSVSLGPEIAGDIVYVTAAADVGARLHALHASDGTKLWTSPLNVQTDTPPVITADRLYISDSDGTFHSLNPLNGTRLWSYPISPQGVAPGPFPAAGAVYFSDGKEVHALRASDGTKIWTFPVGNGVTAIALTNGAICVASNNVYALHADDGRKIWSYPVQANNITAAENTCYIAASTGNLYALHTGTMAANDKR